MRITFHGAAKTVTGSKHLIETEDGYRILLDCGMFQGLGMETLRLNADFGFDAASVDVVILSHAHIDHSGLLPKLVKEGFQGKIYCHHATAELCEIMLMDSAYIQEADAKFINKKRSRRGGPHIQPLYDQADVEATLKLLQPIDFYQETKITNGVQLLLTYNGHILGSASVNLTIRDQRQDLRLCYTGDIGRYGAPLLQDPHPFPQADYIICESTYGNRLHDTHENAAQEIMDAVRYTCGTKRGKLIIPAFSLGRMQEVVYTLNKLDLHGLLPDVKVYVDSPLAVSATQISRKYVDEMNTDVQRFVETGRPDPFGFDDITYIRDKYISQSLNDLTEPCIIISSSGMAEAGRIKHHLRHNIGDRKNSILLVGYAHPLSLSGKLKAGHKEVSIFGEMFPVKADVFHVDAWSAHGDRDEILQFLSCQDASKVARIFLVHGEEEAQEAMKIALRKHGYHRVFIPAHGESVIIA